MESGNDGKHNLSKTSPPESPLTCGRLDLCRAAVDRLHVADEASDVDETIIVNYTRSEDLAGDEVLEHGHHGKALLELLHLDGGRVLTTGDSVQHSQDLLCNIHKVLIVRHHGKASLELLHLDGGRVLTTRDSVQHQQDLLCNRHKVLIVRHHGKALLELLHLDGGRVFTTRDSVQHQQDLLYNRAKRTAGY